MFLLVYLWHRRSFGSVLGDLLLQPVPQELLRGHVIPLRVASVDASPRVNKLRFKRSAPAIKPTLKFQCTFPFTALASAVVPA